jgi:L-threonylcarbamoyladenylate synthase
VDFTGIGPAPKAISVVPLLSIPPGWLTAPSERARQFPVSLPVMTTMQEEIRKCLEVLGSGGTILYPTDTIWGIGCDATNPDAVSLVYQIKRRIESKSMIILLDDATNLSTYAGSIPEVATDLVRQADRPLTIIYPNARNLAANLVGVDGSIAIRIVNHPFCTSLIRAFGKPIVSTSANISGEPAPSLRRQISPEIINSVDYLVDETQGQISAIKPSRIIRFDSTGAFEILRD